MAYAEPRRQLLSSAVCIKTADNDDAFVKVELVMVETTGELRQRPVFSNYHRRYAKTTAHFPEILPVSRDRLDKHYSALSIALNDQSAPGHWHRRAGHRGLTRIGGAAATSASRRRPSDGGDDAALHEPPSRHASPLRVSRRSPPSYRHM